MIVTQRDAYIWKEDCVCSDKWQERIVDCELAEEEIIL
jgi:hypothetical protein